MRRSLGKSEIFPVSMIFVLISEIITIENNLIQPRRINNSVLENIPVRHSEVFLEMMSC